MQRGISVLMNVISSLRIMVAFGIIVVKMQCFFSISYPFFRYLDRIAPIQLLFSKYEDLLRGMSSDKLAASLDNIIGIRAGQDFPLG